MIILFLFYNPKQKYKKLFDSFSFFFLILNKNDIYKIYFFHFLKNPNKSKHTYLIVFLKMNLMTSMMLKLLN